MGVTAGLHYWGKSNTNTGGTRLLGYLVGTQLQILIFDNEPTLLNAIKRKIIDITTTFSDVEAIVEESWMDVLVV